ncbi:hypothetical protein [Streptomyces sp. YKOK-I1]
MATEPAVTSGMPTHEALAMLPLPANLSDSQSEGHVCVYGGEAVTAQTSTDLGSRIVDDRRVFPRACQQCLTPVALGALFDHTTGEEPCADCQTGPECDTGRALNRIIRGLHR